jgi:putative Mg2+ transporter-C (MgtC) family protein
MAGMTTSLTWGEVALRLALTVVAALVLGFDRSEHGKAAGMRTTLLVCLAASVALIQVNMLLPTAGRASDSFVMNDLMRLPLGILTGVGFIGGAILRRGDRVSGVTTAATLWLATVVGLCFGGGQSGLGFTATALGLVALRPTAWIEHRVPRDRTSEIILETDESAPSEDEIRRKIGEAGFSISSQMISVRCRKPTRVHVQSSAPAAPIGDAAATSARCARARARDETFCVARSRLTAQRLAAARRRLGRNGTHSPPSLLSRENEAR